MNREEAIKIVKSHYPANKQMLNEALEFLIPEIREKTDEEMIQKLIAVCHLYYGEGIDEERDECLEWLEKQVKQKPIERREFTSIPFGAFDSELYESMITIPDGCIATIEGNKIHIKREYKTATEAIKKEKVDNSNKIEQRLHVGDYVVRKNGKDFRDGRKFAKITKIDGILCQLDCGSWYYNDEIKPWNLTDAQDGDILASSNNKAFIYNGNYDEISVCAYCGLDVNDDFVIADKAHSWTNNYNIRPATKEERKALFTEMNLFGWIWNPETKELNRLDKDGENNN